MVNLWQKDYRFGNDPAAIAAAFPEPEVAARAMAETEAKHPGPEALRARLAEAEAAAALRRRLEEADAELTAMTLALERQRAEQRLHLHAQAVAQQRDGQADPGRRHRRHLVGRHRDERGRDGAARLGLLNGRPHQGAVGSASRVSRRERISATASGRPRSSTSWFRPRTGS